MGTLFAVLMNWWAEQDDENNRKIGHVFAQTDFRKPMMRCLHDVRTGGTRGEGGAFPRGDKGSSHTFSFVLISTIRKHYCCQRTVMPTRIHPYYQAQVVIYICIASVLQYKTLQSYNTYLLSTHFFSFQTRTLARCLFFVRCSNLIHRRASSD